MNFLKIFKLGCKAKSNVTIKITGKVDNPNNEAIVRSDINTKEITVYRLLYVLSKGVELTLESIADKAKLPIDVVKNIFIENLQKEVDNE